MDSLRKWLYGLTSTAISAAASSITVIAIDPLTFNFDEGLHSVLMVALVSAIIAVANYLKQSPLPGGKCEQDIRG